MLNHQMTKENAFIGSGVPEEIVPSILGLYDVNMPFINWVEASNLHLTFKFLGKINEDIAIEVLKIIEEVYVEALVEFDSIEYWNPGVLVLNAVPNQALQNIKDKVDDLLLKKLAIPHDNFNFKPHVTIGRMKRKGVEKEVIEDYTLRHKNFKLPTFMIHSISLYQAKVESDGKRNYIELSLAD
jgi:2'-5' RNA ligase